MLITNSAKYGITKGSYNTDYLELTPEGKVVVDETQPERDKLRAKFQLAVERVYGGTGRRSRRQCLFQYGFQPPRHPLNGPGKALWITFIGKSIGNRQPH
jgi:hypothetical protein